MKQKILTFSFLLLGFSIIAQNYKPLLDNINEWHFTTCHFGCLTDVYFTDGDTLVDGKNYKILDGYHYISRSFLLREDIVSKQVYLKIASPGLNEEFLLYDFSLDVGATFQMKNPISPFPQEGGPFILDSIIERPLIDGNQYKHFYFSPAPGNTASTENAVWIEGVGSLSMVNAPGGHPNINEVGHLSCFFKNSEAFYANLDSINDCLPLILENKKHNLQKVIVSKPANKNICILSNTEPVKTVTVFDVTGKIIYTKSNNGQRSISIDLSNYQNGMYLIRITGWGQTKKIFKIVK
ncbi:T9SS type A sorting domain-containing protein [Aequorivita sp. SDUM287046]|uniref:T9SS type A sorting domain-containing protein n=1 Tax=Aequorivita aurantiaca TaxID=3053356 RepID=A0ABT8DE37_9FLAO|nr:T9SS type A sorting domain-containing protein [Aequorivita aurantiaca]MDN3723536.1 T9SS type A sorting domain-containing protein [Aequorivita aurantiaca]